MNSSGRNWKQGRHPQKWKLEPIPCFLQVRSYFFCLTPPYVGQKPIPTSYGSNMISSCFCQNRHRFDPKTSPLACRDYAKFGVAMVSFACNGLKGKTSTGNHDFFHSPWKNIKHHLWRFHEVSVNCPIVPLSHPGLGFQGLFLLLFFPLARESCQNVQYHTPTYTYHVLEAQKYI